MEYVIAGASGQLGSEFCKIIDGSIGFSKSGLDISDFKKTKEVLKEIKPDVLINCAAWTAVDNAEDTPDKCFLINVNAVANLAEICNELNCFFVNISSDYVFGKDKERNTPYKESDPTGPVGKYGESKEKGEIATRLCKKHLVIRTCGLYTNTPNGPIRGKNFLDTMFALSKQNKEISIVDDQFCTPSYVPHVAVGILELIKKDCQGTFNVTNSGHTNWFEFANELFNKINYQVKTKAIKSREYVTKAQRPGYSILCDEKFKQNTTQTLPDWRIGISDYISNYNK